MIVVTGATGTTGASVVRALQHGGADFKALARDVERAQSMFGEGVAVVHGDLLDRGSLSAAMEGADTLFLLTPPHDDTLAHNHNVIDAAKRAGVKHVVKLSAIGSAEDSPLQLGRWHAAIERELVESGMACTVLQAGSFMQNFLNHIQTVREHGAVFSVGGDGKVAMIDTRDIAAIAAKVLIDPSAHAGRTYLLTGGEALSDAEATAEIARALGREIGYVRSSPEDARAAMGRMGMPEWLIGDLLMLAEFAEAGYLATVSPHTEELLGRPPTPFAEFATDHKHLFGG